MGNPDPEYKSYQAAKPPPRAPGTKCRRDCTGSGVPTPTRARVVMATGRAAIRRNACLAAVAFTFIAAGTAGSSEYRYSGCWAHQSQTLVEQWNTQGLTWSVATTAICGEPALLGALAPRPDAQSSVLTVVGCRLVRRRRISCCQSRRLTLDQARVPRLGPSEQRRQCQLVCVGVPTGLYDGGCELMWLGRRLRSRGQVTTGTLL